MNTDDIRQMIDHLERIDLANDPYRQAVSIFRAVRGIPAIIFTLEVEELMIFRTRTHDDDVFFTRPSDVINPPAKFVSGFGRCNVPGQSKFYSSENRPTSFMELVTYLVKNKRPGQHVYATVGRWLVKGPVRTLIVVSPDPGQRVSKFDQLHGANFDRIIAKFDQPTQEACKLFYAYLSARFREAANVNPKLYYITAAYCNLVLEKKGPEIDAIYYPSVPFQQQGVNFAFHEDFLANMEVYLLDVLRSTFLVFEDEKHLKNFREIDQHLSRPYNEGQGQIEWDVGKLN